MKFYVVAFGKNFLDLEEDVNKLIDKGFEPFGSVFFNEGYLRQPMVKAVAEGKTALQSYEEYTDELYNDDFLNENDENIHKPTLSINEPLMVETFGKEDNEQQSKNLEARGFYNVKDYPNGFPKKN